MKIAFAAVGLSMASLAAANALCELLCFTQVMNHPLAKSCQEPDMYYCFCRIPELAESYKSCACSLCPSSANNVILGGLELCEDLESPIDWLEPSCSA
ncbi:hypothetical protein SAPIO_CDS7988 [Scedosporium apiospermum]|uniref:Extracellular membrane protein CFEM domain-containing protein n=1 Tax=Pseudallescheria apiosperma TaxID=563466 RepID=A0A084G0H2_PSEDA|nr:uncharacterized protein SAPIO_CDS7988 [Scedosporium apiospermum]KEZ40834.1 hypothetical protein SAPIO_CDS7988 [Scedosporium apiospermum]